MAVTQPAGPYTDGDVFPCFAWNAFTVYKVTAPGAGTPKVQISPDGTAWFDAATFNAAGFAHVADTTAVGAYARVTGGTGTPGSYAVRGLFSHEGG